MIKLSDMKAINVFRDGAWQNQKMGYVYFNGEWVPLLEYRKWIYEEGIEHISLQDGYVRKERYGYPPNITATYEVAKESSRVSFNLSLSDWAGATVGFYVSAKEKINISNFNFLCGVIDTADSKGFRLGISSNDSQKGNGDFMVYGEYKDVTPAEIVRVDIGDLKGDHFIKSGIYGKLADEPLSYLYNIWLE